MTISWYAAMSTAWSPFWRSRASSASRASRIQPPRILRSHPREHAHRHELVTYHELRTDQPWGLESPLLADPDDGSRGSSGPADAAEQARDVVLGHRSVDRTFD